MTAQLLGVLKLSGKKGIAQTVISQRLRVTKNSSFEFCRWQGVNAQLGLWQVVSIGHTARQGGHHIAHGTLWQTRQKLRNGGQARAICG